MVLGFGRQKGLVSVVAALGGVGALNYWCWSRMSVTPGDAVQRECLFWRTGVWVETEEKAPDAK